MGWGGAARHRDRPTNPVGLRCWERGLVKFSGREKSCDLSRFGLFELGEGLDLDSDILRNSFSSCLPFWVRGRLSTRHRQRCEPVSPRGACLGLAAVGDAVVMICKDSEVLSAKFRGADSQLRNAKSDVEPRNCGEKTKSYRLITTNSLKRFHILNRGYL